MKKMFFIVVLLAGLLTGQLVNAQSVTITPSSAEICAGSGTNITLQATPTGGIVIGYVWSTGATSSTIDVSPSVTMTYTVTVTFIGPVSVIESAIVTVIPQPAQGTITVGGPTTFCTGENVQLTASAGDDWQWYQNGNPILDANGQTYFANATGNYTVLVTVGSCNAPMSAATTITVVPPPPAIVTPTGPISECYGNMVTLTVEPVTGATYQWQYSIDGNPPWSDITDETNHIYDAGTSGFYRVGVSVGACVNYSN